MNFVCPQKLIANISMSSCKKLSCEICNSHCDIVSIGCCPGTFIDLCLECIYDQIDDCDDYNLSGFICDTCDKYKLACCINYDKYPTCVQCRNK